MKICIIGAGLAGLTFGALAARDGHEVTVIEKNSVPGGVAALVEQDGFQFEQGQLILADILPGETLSEFLKTLGIELEAQRDFRGLATPDFELWCPDEYAGPCWRREKLRELFPEDAAGIDEYYRFYDALMHIRYLSLQKQTPFIKLRTALTFLKIIKYKDLSSEEFTRRLFKSEKLRLVFTGILADFCADASEVQCYTLPFVNIETAFDSRIPTEKNGKASYYTGFACFRGGMQKLPEALAECILSHGGTILYDTVAERVLIEDGHVTGVRLTDGRELSADFVTGCGSAKDFFENAVGLENLDEKYREILKNYRPMEAVLMVHLGVDFDPLRYQKAATCYYYGSYDLHAATERLRTGVYHEGRDGLLITVPSAHAPEFAPEGCSCVTIYTVCPDTLINESWSECGEKYADQLITLAEKHLPGLREHIVTKKIMTAEDFREMTHMRKCSFGGVVPVSGLQNPTHKTPVKGLYFLGQQSENAGGVSAVVFGARDAYRQFCAEEMKG